MATERPPSEKFAWWMPFALAAALWVTLMLLLLVAEGLADPGPICYDRNPANEVWCD